MDKPWVRCFTMYLCGVDAQRQRNYSITLKQKIFMELNDYLSMRALDKESMSPYEQFKVGHMQSKRASGTAIAGLTVGVGAAVLAVAAGAWAGSQAQKAKEVAAAKNDGLRDLVQTLAGTLAAERSERINGDLNITTTINDTVSGQQSGQLSQSQQLSNDIAIGLMTGKYSENPQKVELYSPAQPFQCGCGCNG